MAFDPSTTGDDTLLVLDLADRQVSLLAGVGLEAKCPWCGATALEIRREQVIVRLAIGLATALALIAVASRDLAAIDTGLCLFSRGLDQLTLDQPIRAAG
jgi:hypothetical protein